jgi:hypothetical protein
MKQIPLNGPRGAGKFALVDDKDYEWLNSRKWYLDTYGYAVTRLYLGKVEGKRVIQNVKMHRLVAMTPSWALTDHIDNTNRLDNRGENLRNCNKQQNAVNSGLHVDNTSGLKGVSWDKQKQRWRATVNYYGQQIFLGRFDEPGEAAYMYDQVALQLFEEFVQLNDVAEDSPLWRDRPDDPQVTMPRRPNTSGHIGVTWDKARHLWASTIAIDRQTVHIGRFESLEEAAYVRDQFALQLYGETAKRNVLDKDYDTTYDL